MSVANYEETDTSMIERQVVSKARVVDHGEVYTRTHEVNTMLDLVKQETERIESRFLEPACGTGNFVMEILERKMHIVGFRYGKSQIDYERNTVLAVSSVYGIDMLEDNVVECRKRLFLIFDQKYRRRFKRRIKEECRKAVRFILEKNIIWGDALTLKTVGDNPRPIVFSEWSPVNGSIFKRRDFAFQELLPHDKRSNIPLFHNGNHPLYSDVGDEAFIPMPVRDFPLTHFMRIPDAEQ